MKNKLLNKRTSMWKVLCISTLLHLGFISIISANYIYGQDFADITIEKIKEKSDLGALFKKIEDQTDYYFTYTDETIKNVNVSSKSNSSKLVDLLSVISSQSGIEFTVKNETIFVVKNKQNNRKITIPKTNRIASYLKTNTAKIQLEQLTKSNLDRPLTGKILDENGEPLIGATIRILETGKGAISDLDGSFRIDVTEGSEAKTLVVSYIGYNTQEVQITNQNNINITLILDQAALEEVVVVGYGTVQKSDLVSAVAKADLSKATATPTSDVNEMLRGRIAGLQVDVGGGTLRPGGTSDIIFRGRGSIEGNVSGIYVVDGIVRTGGIEDINPDDIESIEFLKDASAQAIYGSRAVNGVVLITTKRGKTDDVSVSYHGYLTTRKLERNFEIYNGQEFAQLRREAHRTVTADNSYVADDVIFSNAELASIQNNQFVDWEDELIENGFINSQSIGITAGSENTKVYGSINYFKEDGIIPTSGYTRKNLRLNVDQKISKSISARFDINLLNDDQERAANVNVIGLAPLGRAYDDDGNITRYPSGEEGTALNPLWNLRETDHDEKGNDFVASFLPTWDITDELQYQFKGSFTRRGSERGQYFSSLSGAGDTENGIARIDDELREAYLVENILSYDKEFNKDNKFNFTFVQAIDENKFTSNFTEGRNFVNETLGYDGLNNAIGLIETQRDKSAIRTASFMGRARYNYLDKYLLTATYRRDGASVNAKDYKWTNNPAAAFAWKIHNEDFLKDVSEINQLKLRVSYGSLANALTRPYTSLFTADQQFYVLDGNTNAGYAPSTVLPNPNLNFETITTFNVGLDLSIYKNLITGSIDYYRSNTKDLLLRRGVPPITGYDFTYFNAGELQNKGLELGLSSFIINKQDLQWSVSTNWSNNKNELKDLYTDGNGEPILEDDNFGYFVGQSTQVIRQYEFDGIFQEGDDFVNAPQASPDSIDPQTNLQSGDIRIKDINGDGIITQDDRSFTDSNPKWFGSFSSTLNFKGFELLTDFYAVKGATRVNPILSTFNNISSYSGKNNGIKVPYYTPENPSTTFPRPNADAVPRYLNSLAVKDASYLRLRTLSLGYSLQDNLLSKLKMNQVKFYITGTNVFTDTDYLGYSPEVNVRNSLSGADTGYPDTRSFTFGLKIQP